jgi:pimeloyl-ACP methyl ester carboxylesterase
MRAKGRLPVGSLANNRPCGGFQRGQSASRPDPPGDSARARTGKRQDIHRRYALVVAGETKYARSGDLHLAYQVVGEGPFDLLFFPDWVNHIELQWEEPRQERFLNSLAAFSRLILFNPRGMGPSDPIPVTESPTVELWMDDARAVLDAVGSERPALFGAGAGGTVTMLFAATYPERARALAVVNSTARGSRAPDYPFGIPSEMLDMQRQMLTEHWGSSSHVDAMLPVLAPEDASDERLRAWLPRFQRAAFSPGMAAAAQRLLFGIDIRHALPAIQAPTLVLHRAGIPFPLSVEHGRYLAEHIAGAVYKELPGVGYAFWAGNAQDILDEVEEFLTGSRSAGPPDRVLATVLFTDIVDSTARAAELGDRRWKELVRERARSSSRATTWPASPSTSGRGSPRWPPPARSWFLERWWTWSPARASSSKTGGVTCSREFPGSGRSSR